MADKNSITAPVPLEVPFIGVNQDNAEAKPTRKIKAAPPAPAIKPSSDETRVIAAYRKLNDRNQANMLRAMESMTTNPLLARCAVVPFLRLV